MDGLIERRLAYAAQCLERGASFQAIDVLKQVLGEDPEHANAHAMLAEALVKQRRIHAALHEAELALSLSPESAYCHRALALACVAHRKLDKAREHLQKALELEPSEYGALLQLSAIAMLEGNEKEALKQAESARALAPDDPDALAAVGTALIGLGRLDEAESALRDALAESAEHGDSLLAMGRIALLRGKVAEAREHAVAVLQISPDDAGAVGLLVAIKTRENVFVGLWWRLNAWLTLNSTRAVSVLVGAYLLQRALVTWADLEGHSMTESIIGWAWLGLCVYSWVAPGYYRRLLAKELAPVKFKADF